MSKTAKIEIPKKDAKHLQRLLDSNDSIEKCGEISVYCKFTANLGDGVEADIKIVNSPDGPYVDPVLFYNGSECCVGEPAYTLLGDYHLWLKDFEFVVTVEESK